ncbi:MAG: DUF111 family protein [Thaumarchaeota archaeon]|nr:DUF111 family protein [Nitrososphaerota archaeon]
MIKVFNEVSPADRKGGNSSKRNVHSSDTKIHFQEDAVAVIESNVDDVTGEVLSETIDRLIDEGAYDATVSSYLGKKGRMGQTIRAVCAPKSVPKFSQIIVEETGTLGVKVSEFKRLIVPRREMRVKVSLGKFSGTVGVKVAETGKGFRIKPETEEARKIVRQEKIPLRKVLEYVTQAAELELE